MLYALCVYKYTKHVFVCDKLRQAYRSEFRFWHFGFLRFVVLWLYTNVSEERTVLIFTFEADVTYTYL